MSIKVKRQSKFAVRKPAKRGGRASTTVYFPQFPEFSGNELEAKFELELEVPQTTWSTNKIKEFNNKFKQIRQPQSRNSRQVDQVDLNVNDDRCIRIHDLIKLANSVFGFNGWSTCITDPGKILRSDVQLVNTDNVATDNYFDRLKAEKKTELEDEETKIDDYIQALAAASKFSYEMEVMVELELKLLDGTTVKGAGISKIAGITLKSLAFSKAKKEAHTNAIKQCFFKLEGLLVNHQERWKLHQFNWG